ncbi:DUF445 family protein [Clostridium estertheticum]|uniref:DUF445 family protein n=1 Tax=Clostridium estertheticum TaxID=238834 RepID=UPI001CF594B7|nr:DUF445 family protein [Clostridium estertheticum]MCB2306448.1 DUF445 family protein [Clostridium estertheticum]MCB2344824.1 DUF445 family protein [Clostridium estertheticum]MCB2349747.1 DUF445 family protein [Clostridium estertheticum]WAG46903.1 DUF445 family protein [Clostridium estertheticum]
MKFIIGSLVGAIIGYITNWLAIKMLFRPHKEIRILNIKVPFTPGLIPKEKSRIARSVGESIGQHLLTKETILKSLCSDEMDHQLDTWVQGKVSTMKNSNATVESELKDILGDEYYNISQSTISNVSKSLINYISDVEVRGGIAKYVYAQIMSEINAKPQAICESELYNSIKNKVLNLVMEYKDSQDFYKGIQNMLKAKVAELVVLDKKIEDVIPGEITNSLKVYVYGKRYNIAMEIKKMIKEEKNSKKLRQIVDETISTKLSPMIAMFISKDSVFEKVVIGIDEYLDNVENHNDIALIINDIIDKLLKNSISSVVFDLPKEGIDNVIEPLINLFTTRIVDKELILSTFEKLESKFNSYISVAELLEKTGIEYKSVIEGFIKSRINSIIENESTKSKINEIVGVMINRLLHAEMKSIFKGEGDEVTKSVSKVVKTVYNKFIENKAPEVIEVLDIAKIVEEKINEFDVAFSERIILEIASKELNAITWLGALLGAIMGLLSPILGSM